MKNSAYSLLFMGPFLLFYTGKSWAFYDFSKMPTIFEEEATPFGSRMTLTLPSLAFLKVVLK